MILFIQIEIANHESRINVVLKEGEKMITEGHYGEEEIQTKITELQHHWQNLKVFYTIYKES